MKASTVAIVGRPNVGKSTLFNRMTRSHSAIVHDKPGVTRDRIYGVVDREEQGAFRLIDTGGFESDKESWQPFGENLVWRQTEAAIHEADLVCLVCDAKAGLHPLDQELARYLQQMEKPFILVVNKVDSPEKEDALWEFYGLGIEWVVAISSAHNRGVRDLAEEILEALSAQTGHGAGHKPDDGVTNLAIVGRPNVGKSSILNRLTGSERSLVSDVAGTTRDALDTPLTYKQRDYRVVDTAGIRRKARISEKLEAVTVGRSLEAIERADVVFLILDASEGLTDQDARLADMAARRFKPVCLVVNKWDLIPEKTSNTAKEFRDSLARLLASVAFAPVMFISCLRNQRVHDLLAVAERLSEMASRRAPTRRVNEVLQEAVNQHSPALSRSINKRPKFYYATQVSTNPPTIVVFCNVADQIQESYKRYMTHRFRKGLGFEEIPIRLLFRDKSEDRDGE